MIYVVQLINYTLAVIMWLIIGRLLLTPFVGNKRNFMMDFFIRFTEPVYNVTRRILPFAKGGWVAFFTLLIIVILRFVLVVTLTPEK